MSLARTAVKTDPDEETDVTDQRRPDRTHFRLPADRRGSITLELIIMLPVWLIVMGAVVQFGLLIGNRQQMALAARVGAEEASKTVGLNLTDDGELVPANVVTKVEQQLQSSGIEQCKVTLEHNLVGSPPPTTPITLTTGECNCPTLGVSTTWPPASGRYVRVTVYVPATELTPNILKFFGFDISELYIRNAATFRHELPLP